MRQLIYSKHVRTSCQRTEAEGVAVEIGPSGIKNDFIDVHLSLAAATTVIRGMSVWRARVGREDVGAGNTPARNWEG